ncbi:RluA family pseudouridine synthase [Rickettsiales endosymbiont of Peranema trichophorum]|uniref:RluA family pseudouridine synthase n=1 Tax=Rickettsiales endosymbiont of Peranema trichophorum TaxID=2486577 RepID=UPI001023AFF3|nr:RluA family pseudouridine synthase [Rickettsiales endosymbiont of Peranema trichophorum]RZI45993.1 RluA family pseudouridine synthase [Rickettsiales endosymbiont of Peranema trichophorum]
MPTLINTLEFQVLEADTGQRVDKFLAAQLITTSRSKIKDLIIREHVFVNGQVVTDPAYKIRPNQRIEVAIPNPTDHHIAVSDTDRFGIEIVYQDEYLLVVNKPAGLITHPGNGDNRESLVSILQNQGMTLANTGDDQRPGIVHRLDKDTSGLLIVAKTNQAHSILVQQLSLRTIKRTYQAAIYGVMCPIIGTIRTKMAKEKRNRTKMAVTRDSGKDSVTHYKTLEMFGSTGASLVECQLETGRTHQIRVHFAYKGHQLIGDQTYGLGINHNLRSLSDSAILAITQFRRQALHATALEFEHPITLEPVRCASNLPEDIEKLLGELRKM